MKIVGFVADALAVAVVNIAEMLAPDRVVVGGGVAVALPTLIACTSARLGGFERTGFGLPAVEPARLGRRSSLEGAVLLAHMGGA